MRLPEIRHLLPNHTLDLTTGRRRRYWPDGPIGRLELAQAADTLAGLLTALFRAAAARFPLSLATTAGWDTRLILATCREFRDGMYFYTRRTADRADVTRVPRLMARLGLPHHLISFPDRMDPEFARIYNRNMTEAHDYWGRMCQRLYEVYPEERVCANGDSGDRPSVFASPPGEAVTARALAALTSAGKNYQDELRANPFVVRACEEWLAGVGELYDMNVLDLFYWEQYGGTWQSGRPKTES